jgi:hypothetical protein
MYMTSKASCSAAEVLVPVQLGNGQSGVSRSRTSLGDDEVDRAAAAAKEVGKSDKKFVKWIQIQHEENVETEGMSSMKVKRMNTAQEV